MKGIEKPFYLKRFLLKLIDFIHLLARKSAISAR